MRVGVMGATGYAGAEVLRLAATHPDLEVVLATGASTVGERVGEVVASLAGAYPTLTVSAADAVADSELDVVFLALPHGESQVHVPGLLARGLSVVDLGADFRLRDADLYREWYGHEHHAPALLDQAVYGLVERHRKDLPGASLIAVPGCYPTAVVLALGAFIDAGVVEREGIVVNALSGVSGAGRATSERLQFARLSASAEAYGLINHRHTPEMQQELGATLLFTPHLVPVARGMLVTAYARVAASSFTTEDALALLRETHAEDPFVVVTEDPPTMKDPLASNLCFLSARVDARTGWLIAMSSIDNLTKGAAGQAIQAWNVANQREETLGLPLVGVNP